MKRIIMPCFLLLAAAALMSCNRVHEQYHKVSGLVWNYHKPEAFHVDIKEAGHYTVQVSLRNNNDFPYQNIWMKLRIDGPDGKSSTQRMNCYLSDNLGRWQGQRLGGLYDSRFPAKLDTAFSKPGSYTFTLQHDMREDNMPGVVDVGLKVKELKPLN
jgi:gliding motility-associated lipoprotein GldH